VNHLADDRLTAGEATAIEVEGELLQVHGNGAHGSRVGTPNNHEKRLFFIESIIVTNRPCYPQCMAIEPEPRLLSAFSSLEIRHLLALDAVSAEGTFGKAAERLGYTQSAVSQQIAALERAIGGAVFDRPGGPKPVRITPLGKLVLAHARELLDRAQATADAIERFKAGEGRIDVGTFQSVSNVLLPQIVMQLREEHPAVDIRVFEEDTAVERLLAGELDLAYWVGPLDGPIESVKLLDDPYVLVCRRGDFPDGPVPCEQLDGVQMVSFPRMLCDMGRVEDTFAALGVEPLIVFRTADNGAVMSMVRAGMGAAVMPMLAIDIGPDDVLCTHELRPVIRPREVCVMWQAGRTLSPLARRVIDISVSVASDVAERRSATGHNSRVA
jgi:DNA-binding transcriptional LysR family regulator